MPPIKSIIELDPTSEIEGKDQMMVWDASSRKDVRVALTDMLTSLDVDTTPGGDLEGLTPTDGNFIVGAGADWIVESGQTARDSMAAAGGLRLAADVTSGPIPLTVQFTISGPVADLSEWCLEDREADSILEHPLDNTYKAAGTTTLTYVFDTAGTFRIQARGTDGSARAYLSGWVTITATDVGGEAIQTESSVDIQTESGETVTT